MTVGFVGLGIMGSRMAANLIKKDLHLAALSGYENGVPLLLTGLSKDMYMAAVQKGWGDEDFAAIFKLFATDKPQNNPE